jgi:hypothetical protein
LWHRPAAPISNQELEVKKKFLEDQIARKKDEFTKIAFSRSTILADVSNMVALHL